MFRNISLITIFFVTCVFSTQVMARDAVNHVNNWLTGSIELLDIQGVKEALMEGADPNGDGGTSPLKRAMGKTSKANTTDKNNALTSIIEVLFQYGAKLTKDDASNFLYPLKNGPIEVVRVLLENGASALQPIRGQFPIAIAEAARQNKIVDLLIEFGVAPLSESEILQIKLVSFAGELDLDGVKATLSAGAKINEPAIGNQYALVSALFTPYFSEDPVEVVEFLLSRNADPNVLGYTSNTHATPLTSITGGGYSYWMTQQNEKEKERYRQSILRVIDLLVEHGADIELRDGREMAPIHIAAENDSHFAVKKLIELGADIGILDGKGRTPFEFAKSETIKNLLKQEGKKQAKYDKKNFDKGKRAFIKNNYQEALPLLRPFSEIGDVTAQLLIGVIYYYGDDSVKKDYGEAIKWLRKASKRGVSPAQWTLGIMYSKGLGIKRDLVKAAKWYLRAAEQGNTTAQIELGNMYYDGKGGLEVNKVKATNLYRLAAEGGDQSGQVLLGILLWGGNGVTQDKEEALIWFRNAVASTEKGKRLAVAYNSLGEAYRLGLGGVAKDSVESAKWHRLAAEQGYSDSQFMLGVLYSLGDGVPKDDVLAYMWVNLAAVGGQGGKKLRDSIGRRLSKGQLAEAQHLTRNWKPGSSKDARRKEPTNNSRKKLSGTGFFISKEGRVLTNYHVVKGCKELSVQMPSGYKSAASVATKDERDDLAILATEKMTDSVAQFRVGASPQVGEQVVIYGFPLAGILSSSGNLVTGNLSALAGLRNNPRHYQITAPVQPGNSGGSLLDESGRVIGVIVSKLDAAKFAEATGDIPQNINFAIKGSTALNFIEANGVKPQFTMKSDKLTTTEIAKKAEGYTVQVICSK